MHYTRILALVGGVIAAIALFLKSASSDAGEVLTQLSQADDAFPAGFDNIWTAIYDDKSWAAILLVIAVIVAVALVLMPPVRAALQRIPAAGVALAGIVALAVSVIAMMDAMDSVSTLNDGFELVFAGGLTPEQYTASIGFGWYLLVGGSLLIAVAGLIGAFTSDDS